MCENWQRKEQEGERPEANAIWSEEISPRHSNSNSIIDNSSNLHDNAVARSQ